MEYARQKRTLKRNQLAKRGEVWAILWGATRGKWGQKTRTRKGQIAIFLSPLLGEGEANKPRPLIKVGKKSKELIDQARRQKSGETVSLPYSVKRKGSGGGGGF